MTFHIAVILPERYRGGTLRGAKNIARMLKQGATLAGDNVRVTFAHIDDDSLYDNADFVDLREEGIGVRPFKLSSLKAEHINPYFGNGVLRARDTDASQYLVFNDGMSNLEDADFWVLISDRIGMAIPPHRRYAVVVYDYIQRYVPDIFGVDEASENAWRSFDNFARAAAQAAFVICTTRQTRRDCISYAGADPERVFVFPMEFDPINGDGMASESSVEDGGDPYLLWTTNSTEHKNHLNVIEGLERYFRDNPASTLKVRMSGVYTHLFSDEDNSDKYYDLPHAKRVRRKLAESPLVKKRLTILGNVPDNIYLEQLQGAAFVLHGALYDNGTYSVVEGAWHGVPSISSDYPAMREIEANFSLPLTFFEPRQPQTLAAAIASAWENRDSLAADLPPRDRLASRSFEKIAPQYWVCLRQALDQVEGP